MLQKRLFLVKLLRNPLKQVSIKNDHLSLEALDYGAIIRKLKFRVSDNSWVDLCVSLNSPEAYLNDPFAIGACAGRFAGRLSGGFLQVEGETFPISHSDGITLHGGKRGFAKRYWKMISKAESTDTSEVRLTYKSRHLEEGFPGNLDVKATYTLSKNVLIIRYEASTDRPTVVNLTNHTYFKIDSQPQVSHYQFLLHAAKRAETDSKLLPTGRILEVSGTEFDFQTARPIGELPLDTPFLLNSQREAAARLTSAVSGVRMTMHTNQPAVVVYTPGGFAGICLETQNLPDAPRHGHFPNSFLYPGETYVNETQYVFESLI